MKLLNLLKITSFALVILVFTQCSKYKGETEQYTVNSPGMGAQVVPATSSAATAVMTGTYNSTDNTLTGTLTWSGLSGAPTAIHFHGPAAVGRNNIAQFNLVKIPAVASGTMNFQSAFTGSQQGTLISGGFYFDIHTAAFPNGEIRGQIILQ
ncbi:MAG: CHRD domain-containing protein [Bacteroidota bacterium]